MEVSRKFDLVLHVDEWRLFNRCQTPVQDMWSSNRILVDKADANWQGSEKKTRQMTAVGLKVSSIDIGIVQYIKYLPTSLQSSNFYCRKKQIPMYHIFMSVRKQVFKEYPEFLKDIFPQFLHEKRIRIFDIFSGQNIQ